MRCINSGCVDYTETRNNYCGRYSDVAECDDMEPRNLAKPNVKPQLCDSLPDDKEIEFVASDESNGIDFNDLRYRSVWEEGFIKGAEWMKTRVK